MRSARDQLRHNRNGGLVRSENRDDRQCWSGRDDACATGISAPAPCRCSTRRHRRSFGMRRNSTTRVATRQARRPERSATGRRQKRGGGALKDSPLSIICSLRGHERKLASRFLPGERAADPVRSAPLALHWPQIDQIARAVAIRRNADELVVLQPVYSRPRRRCPARGADCLI